MSFLGLLWWSLALVVAASLVVAKALRLGEQSWAPISAMLILAVSAPGTAAEVRFLNTVIGTLVGVGFSVLVPIAIPKGRAHDAVRRVARSQAALLDLTYRRPRWTGLSGNCGYSLTAANPLWQNELG